MISNVYSILALSPHPFPAAAVLLFIGNETVIISQASVHGNQAAFFIPLAGVNVIRLLVQGIGYNKLACLPACLK